MLIVNRVPPGKSQGTICRKRGSAERKCSAGRLHKEGAGWGCSLRSGMQVLHTQWLFMQNFPHAAATIGDNFQESSSFPNMHSSANVKPDDDPPPFGSSATFLFLFILVRPGVCSAKVKSPNCTPMPPKSGHPYSTKRNKTRPNGPWMSNLVRCNGLDDFSTPVEIFTPTNPRLHETNVSGNKTCGQERSRFTQHRKKQLTSAVTNQAVVQIQN